MENKKPTKKRVSARKVVPKVSKITATVPVKDTISPKRWDVYNLQFLILLILFAGFSVYAIFSFYISTNGYIRLYGSVTDSANGEGPQPAEIFKDVKEGDYASLAIQNLRDLGIITGYEDGSYRPNDSINRAEFLHTITKAVEADLTGKLYSDCFTDVKAEWFAPFVCYAKDKKWISGFADNSYHPSQSVVYGEALKIVIMAFNIDVPKVVVASPMDGVKITDWYAPYVKAALDNGVIDLGGTFDANRNITRADLAQLIYRAMPDK